MNIILNPTAASEVMSVLVSADAIMTDKTSFEIDALTVAGPVRLHGDMIVVDVSVYGAASCQIGNQHNVLTASMDFPPFVGLEHASDYAKCNEPAPTVGECDCGETAAVPVIGEDQGQTDEATQP
jgi:hypothetical protein